MSTTLRGSSLGRDNKKGTSPSTSLIKKPTKLSSQTPSSSTTVNPSSSRDVKPVSNSLKTPQKTSLDLPQKTAINRRRSFERPPPVSQVQKAIRNNVPVTREVKPTNRSTSFSHKQTASSIATPSTRPASNRTYARTTSALNKKEGTSSRSIIKKDTSSSSIKKPSSIKSTSSESSIDQLVIEDDLVNMDNFEVQSLPDMSEMPDINQELGDPTIAFPEVRAEQPVVDVNTHINNVDQLVEKSIDIFVHSEIETQPEASQNVEEEQILTADCNETSDSNKAQTVAQSVIEIVEEKKEEVGFEEELEKKLEETVVKDEKPSVIITPAARPEPVKRAQIAFGKKEKQQDYNDVIEETATKLMGGRKNKVLALAGAFETVISLQDSSKN